MNIATQKKTIHYILDCFFLNIVKDCYFQHRILTIILCIYFVILHALLIKIAIFLYITASRPISIANINPIKIGFVHSSVAPIKCTKHIEIIWDVQTRKPHFMLMFMETGSNDYWVCNVFRNVLDFRLSFDEWKSQHQSMSGSLRSKHRQLRSINCWCSLVFMQACLIAQAAMTKSLLTNDISVRLHFVTGNFFSPMALSALRHEHLTGRAHWAPTVRIYHKSRTNEIALEWECRVVWKSIIGTTSPDAC